MLALQWKSVFLKIIRLHSAVQFCIIRWLCWERTFTATSSELKWYKCLVQIRSIDAITNISPSFACQCNFSADLISTFVDMTCDSILLSRARALSLSLSLSFSLFHILSYTSLPHLCDTDIINPLRIAYTIFFLLLSSTHIFSSTSHPLNYWQLRILNHFLSAICLWHVSVC